MSDTASTSATSTTDTSASATSSATASSTPASSTATSSATEAKTAEWYETELSKVRAEAAKYRTEKRDAVEVAKADVAKSFEDKITEAAQAHEATKAEASQFQVELTKLKAALGAVDADVLGRAEKFAGLLHGVTVEEIQTQAEQVKELLGGSWGRTPAIDPSPEGKPLALNDDDGLLAALKGAVGIS